MVRMWIRAVDGQAEDSGAEDEEPESGDGLGHQVRDVYVSGYLVQGDGTAGQPPPKHRVLGGEPS